mmetsp:Transcript_5114/g.12870  ORF Transcript_5114/g.12870 Transcript_5114/m.12870 type:complete len:231 (-) Transcript_5114:351-1043(-)
MARPFSSVSCRARIASCASSALVYSTMPQPLERPSGPVMTLVNLQVQMEKRTRGGTHSLKASQTPLAGHPEQQRLPAAAATPARHQPPSNPPRGPSLYSLTAFTPCIAGAASLVEVRLGPRQQKPSHSGGVRHVAASHSRDFSNLAHVVLQVLPRHTVRQVANKHFAARGGSSAVAPPADRGAVPVPAAVTPAVAAVAVATTRAAPAAAGVVPLRAVIVPHRSGHGAVGC